MKLSFKQLVELTYKYMKELLEQYVEKIAYVYVGGLNVEVTIIDVKKSYGKERFLVTPVSGSQEVWVEKVTLK